MTLFEYLGIAFGLLFALAAMRLIGGIPHAVDKSRRYWVHLTLVASLLLAVTVSFWTLWSLNDVAWTFPKFVIALTLPGLLFFMAATLVPENPRNVDSWFQYYYAIRRRFFVGFGCYALAAAVSARINLNMAWVHPLHVGHVALLLFGIVGAVSRSPRVHSWLVIFVLTFALVSGFIVGVQPGWLAE